MKRLGNLFDFIASFDNLLRAFYKARKGKRSKNSVLAFEAFLEYELLKLRNELYEGTYRPGGYRTFTIRDPKVRMISAAPFRDRVVHHALCNVIEPIFDPTFISDTYANRVGKGTHAGIRRCQEFGRKYDYALKADIQKYFPSIDHAILKEIVRKKIKCVRTLMLVDTIIDYSNPQEKIWDYFSGDNLFDLGERRKGLPMGNLTSQFLANLYLSPLDHFIKEDLGIKGYVRYVDDFVVFHRDKQVLHQAEAAIRAYLRENLRLRLHPRKTVVFPTKDGITILGQRVFHHYRRLKRENVLRFRKRLANRLELYRLGAMDADKMESQLNSWLGHARQADTFRLRKKIFRNLRAQGLNLFETHYFSWKLLELDPFSVVYSPR